MVKRLQDLGEGEFRVPHAEKERSAADGSIEDVFRRDILLPNG